MSWRASYQQTVSAYQQLRINQVPQFPGYGVPSLAPPGVNPELWQWFVSVDQDKNGKITVEELQRALLNGNWSPFNEVNFIHLNPNARLKNHEFTKFWKFTSHYNEVEETCRLMIGMFDRDRSGTIDIYEFEALWKYIQDWKRCFDSFDRDKSGTIDGHELHQALTTFGYRLTPNFCQLVIQKTALILMTLSKHVLCSKF